MGKRLEQTLLQGGHTEGPETYEKMLSTLAIGEMQIKTTMRYYFILVRMAIIHKSTNKCWRGCREKGNLVHCWWEEREKGRKKERERKEGRERRKEGRRKGRRKKERKSNQLFVSGQFDIVFYYLQNGKK